MASIKQKSVIVEVEADAEGKGARKITVRRMPWKYQRDFLKAFAKAVQAILQGKKEGGLTIGQIVLDRLADIVGQSDELVTILCTGSTGLSLDEFDQLDGLVASEVLRQAIDVNFDEELKNSFAGIAVALAALMPAETKTTSPATSTPT